MKETMDFNRILKALKQLGDLYDDTLTKTALGIGISKQEADVLLFIANNPQHNTASNIAKHRSFSRAYVSKAVEKLTAGKLVDVIADGGDRRVQRLVTTDAAAEKSGLLQWEQRQFFKGATRGISEKDMNICLEVMERIAENALAISRE
ncbi:MAG: MarR family transcriptional regulator [Oscillospiraceae bacterium]